MVSDKVLLETTKNGICVFYGRNSDGETDRELSLTLIKTGIKKAVLEFPEGTTKRVYIRLSDKKYLVLSIRRDNQEEATLLGVYFI